MIVPNDRIADVNIVRAVRGTGVRIPFFASQVQAGFPSPAENYIEQSLSLDELCIRHPEATYFVTVASDSMIGDRIDRGDVLVVDCAQLPSEGKIVVVWLNGDNVVKRIHYVGGPSHGEIAVLMPSNPNYEPIYVHPGDNFRMLGVVTFVIQKSPIAMLSLVDANNFYVSCQRSFDPSLEGKPVIVLSNNDGCAVARSNEAKDLGIPMGAPVFQLTELVQTHNVQVFSSNYTLYGDMSARLISLLGRFVEHVEVNSIDEAFLDMSEYGRVYPDLLAMGRDIRETAAQWLRIPVSVGIAPTKSLTKVANWYAKRDTTAGGVIMLDTEATITAALEDFKVGELWGIGSRYAALLRRNGILTARQFRDAPDDWINQHLTVNGLRLAYELRGRPCKLLETETKAKKAICSAPSFGRLVPDLDTMKQALATHISRAAEKLRRQHSAAGTMTVFLHTNRYKRSPNRGDGPGELAKQYYNSRSIDLPHPTASTSELIRYALAGLESIFRFGYDYQKVGVILSGLVPDNAHQTALFHAGPDERLVKLNGVVDRLNTRFGRDKLRVAAAGFDPSWHHRQLFMSPCYTTRWQDILPVK